ncbi:MAG: hypothetical protein JW715_12780 [Sedimentisphaerales bacterium]|nr:hypothetical protein [Sedimentisphaerales bacterium]
MKKKLNLLPLFFSFLLLAGTGCQDSGRFAVSGKGGTLGLGGDFTMGVTSNVNARAGFNMLDIDFDEEEIDDVEYDLGVELSSLSALLDWHVFNNSFRITGGLISMDNSINLDARPTESVEIGDNIYLPADVGTLSGSVEFDNIAPYVGIGWGNPLTSNQRWGITCDLGVAFTDSPDVALSATGLAAGLAADIEKERKEIEDDLDSLKFYPVISFGLFYRF